MSDLHLRLTHDDFLAVNEQLTEGELRLYLYLRTLDPFGDRKLEIQTAVIAEQLGLTRRTIQKCLNSLSVKSLIDWEVISSRISTRSANTGSPSERRIAKRSKDRFSESRIVSANLGSPERIQDRQQPLEVTQDKDSTSSHTSSTFINLSQTEIDDENLNEERSPETFLPTTSVGNETEAIALPNPEAKQESPEQPQDSGEGRSSPAPTDDRKILDFIIKTTMRKGVDLANPEAYAKKCLQQNGEHWRSLHADSKRPKQPIKEFTDPYQAESSIAMAIKMGDKDFARGKLENLRQRGEEALADRLSEKFGGVLCR